MSEFYAQSPNTLGQSQQLEAMIDNLVAEQPTGGEITRYHGGHAENTVVITPDQEAQGYHIVWTSNAKPSSIGVPFASFNVSGEINRGFLSRGGSFTTIAEELPPNYNHEAMARSYVEDVLPYCTDKSRGPLGRILFRKFGI